MQLAVLIITTHGSLPQKPRKLFNISLDLFSVRKFFYIKHQIIDLQKIIDYAIKLDIGAVIRRLGYLMELYQIGSRIHLDFLQTRLTQTYQLLDPDLPAEGRHIAKWRLRLNIPEEELLALRRT